MKNDLIRAFCIASMVVPIFALSRIARATTPVDLTAEQEFFYLQDTLVNTDSFRVKFFEQLFGSNWSAADAVYRMHPIEPNEIEQAVPFTTLCTNGSEIPFLMTVRSILEINLGQISQDIQGVVLEAHVDRAWFVYGDFETELGYISTIAILLQGSDGEGASWLRVIPGHLFRVSNDGLSFATDDPYGNIIAMFDDCTCPSGLCDIWDPEQRPEAIIVTICAVAALVGGAIGCLSSRDTCRDTANAESVFCANRCEVGDDECHQCCFDRWQIAIDSCGLCGTDRPSPSDFSRCYENDNNGNQ